MAVASSFSAMNWIFSSMVRTTLEPASGVLSALSYQRLCASVRISMRAALLRMRSSSWYSIPPDALLVDIDIAENGRGQIALGVKALVFLLEIDSAQVQLAGCAPP